MYHMRRLVVGKMASLILRKKSSLQLEGTAKKELIDFTELEDEK